MEELLIGIFLCVIFSIMLEFYFRGRLKPFTEQKNTSNVFCYIATSILETKITIQKPILTFKSRNMYKHNLILGVAAHFNRAIGIPKYI